MAPMAHACPTNGIWSRIDKLELLLYKNQATQPVFKKTFLLLLRSTVIITAIGNRHTPGTLVRQFPPS